MKVEVKALGVGESGKAHAPLPMSEILKSLISENHTLYTVSEIANVLAARSLGGLLAFFGALNIVPMPPGTSTITGLPIILIAFQLLMLQKRIFLPRFIGDRTIKPNQLSAIINRLVPWTEWVERFLRPRYWPFAPGFGDRFTGLVTLLLGLVVVFPIPFGNLLPAIAVFILGLALSERDGIWLGFGLFAALLSFLLITSIIWGAVLAIATMLGIGD